MDREKIKEAVKYLKNRRDNFNILFSHDEQALLNLAEEYLTNSTPSKSTIHSVGGHIWQDVPSQTLSVEEIREEIFKYMDKHGLVFFPRYNYNEGVNFECVTELARAIVSKLSEPDKD